MSFRSEIDEAGFAIVPDVFSLETIDPLLKHIDQFSSNRSRAGVRHAMRFPPIQGVARHPKMMEMAKEVLGRDAFPYRATLFDKSRAANWLVVWHQDTALPLLCRQEWAGWGPWSVKEGIDYALAPARALSRVLTLRVSLDDSMAENGPLRVLPGTHKFGVLGDEGIHELSARILAVDCTCQMGGVVAMQPLLVHGSSKSNSLLSRRVLHIEYAASQMIAEPMRLAIV